MIDKMRLALVLLVVVVTILTCIDPVYPHEQILQHIGTILLLIPLTYDIFKKKIPIASYIGIICFTILHVIGARYVYSYVPYKEFAISLGIVDTDFFQDSRNHYDRFVHFSFGVLLFPYLVYVSKSRFKQLKSVAVFMAWMMIQTCSMIYELFEWLLTIVMTSEEADYYNGQQGDIWDAQKDMALALLGSTFMAVLYLLNYYRKSRIK
ncbi:MAG: DUF2238 domain-containing protein [Prevotellaceae bacterium]|nr:DUF2238 domain-containing protein [Prevotellaceae bacterium]